MGRNVNVRYNFFFIFMQFSWNVDQTNVRHLSFLVWDWCNIWEILNSALFLANIKGYMYIGGSKRGHQDAPGGPNSFIFMQFSENK